MSVHYASRKGYPCPTADQPLLTACELPVALLPKGDVAREDIGAVTCQLCKEAHAIWVDMRERAASLPKETA